MGHSNGVSRQRGSIVLYLVFSIAASVAAGYGVYVLVRDHKSAIADDAVAEPTPVRPAPRAEVTPKPAESVAVAEADPAELAAVEPNLIESPKDVVLFGTPGVAGALAVDSIEHTIKRYTVRYERCMRRARERGVTPAGSLRITLIIAEDGKVDYATGKPTSLDEELAVCVVEVVNDLRFGKSTDGAKVKVVYPIAFVAATVD